MFTTYTSPFIEPSQMPSMIEQFMVKKYGLGCDWSRTEVCNAVANNLVNTYGFVSHDDLEIKLLDFIDSGSMTSIANQIPKAVMSVDLDDLFADLDEIFTPSKTHVPPKYQVQTVQRGQTEDKFFCKPINVTMVDNATVIKTLNSGTNEEICALPNLSCSCPPVKMKCDISCESILFVQATYTLIMEYGLTSMADIYRFLGMLGDRKCVWCKEKKNHKIACVSGTFQCINCLNKHKRIDFKDAFKAWLDAGCPAKHAVLM